jgi:hypothetical protein
MKKLTLFIVMSAFCGVCTTYAQLLPGYNPMFYNTVVSAAEGVGKPFFLMQGVMTMPGVTVFHDSVLSFEGHHYKVHSEYQNPVTGNPNHYYVDAAEYDAYQIQSLAPVWPARIPNVLYNYSDSTFNSLADCVGYGTRLLSAIGDATTAGNSYLALIATVKLANTTMFASPGWVASAYEFGAAFATLSDVNTTGWGYVAGSVLADSINAFNHQSEPTLNTYNGINKPGYNNAAPGDILSLSYRPGGASNGHFMVITNTPYLIGYDTIHKYYPNVPDASINNFLGTYHVYATPVYDCSGKKAHFNDSRKFMSGIGHGTLWIMTDPANETPMGYIFEPPVPTVTAISPFILGPTHLWAITVGRFKEGSLEVPNQGSLHRDTPFLMQNFPNPVNNSTAITFFIPGTGKTMLNIYDMKGNLVVTPVDGIQPAGSHTCRVETADLPGGIYLYSLTWKDMILSGKMHLIK